MSFPLKIGFLAIIAFSIFFASWYALHGDIVFGADVARDFHLLREIDEKKIVLIGPRASGDLFHGPGWPYLNYPFYLIGGGSPVAVGFGWVILTAISGAVAYFVGKNLFDIKTGYLFSIMVTLNTAFHAKGMINPDGVMILIPLFFLSFVKYLKEGKSKFLLLNIVVGGLMVQMELMAIPLLVLSFGAILVKQLRKRRFRQIFLFLLFPILLLNFIAFDLRHDFLLLQRFLEFASPEGGPIYSYSSFLWNRIDLAFQGTEILRRNMGPANLILFLMTLGILVYQVKNKKYQLTYLSFLYFYFGYYVLSLFNKGQVLYFHQFPLFPLVFLAFSSFITSKYRKVFLILFLVVLGLNLKSAYLDIKESKSFIGQDMYSWKFLNDATQKAFTGDEKELGYFVYAPDVLAYEPKYAMIYNSERSDKGISSKSSCLRRRK
ncbi:MAG: hypothetical protein UU52_C0007G0003 [Candidatus Levybacteria bacterium GW2011_GWB1_41_21]|nr:MAG: hypothetical protein UU52_C0007G0003 [Candidatus Levybacteria bacterium GW2011_GWB1_41_21]